MNGRPTIFSEELAAKICSQIMDGKSLRAVCRADDMPNRDTVHSWLSNNKRFSDQYVYACQLRRESKFEEIEDIAVNEPDVQRARLRIDVVKWQLSKEEPKKYGDKLDMTTNGKDLPTPILGGLTKNVQIDDGDKEASQA